MKTLKELGISPTPWTKLGDCAIYREVLAADNSRVLDNDWNATDPEDPKQEPNARLIAAAPELYEALAAMLSCAEKEAPFTTESGMSIAMDMARKAVEKAGSGE